MYAVRLMCLNGHFLQLTAVWPKSSHCKAARAIGAWARITVEYGLYNIVYRASMTNLKSEGSC